MASFNDDIPLQSSVSSETGDRLTVNDLHDYSGDTTEGVVYADVLSRTFTFYDSDGEQYGDMVDATVVLDGDYSVTIAIDKDRYVESHLLIVLTDTTEYLNIEKFGIIQGARYKQNILIRRNERSKQNKIQDILTNSSQYIQAAIDGHKYGHAPYDFDSLMNAANKLLNTLSYC